MNFRTVKTIVRTLINCVLYFFQIGFRRDTNDNLIRNISRKADQVIWEGLRVFSCKFSKNKNSLNIFGWSTAHGEIYIQSAGDGLKAATFNRSKAKS